MTRTMPLDSQGTLPDRRYWPVMIIVIIIVAAAPWVGEPTGRRRAVPETHLLAAAENVAAPSPG